MRVLVVGAGISGMTAALQLRGAGHDVVVMDRRAAARTDGYILDFFGPGYDAAERMGLLPALAEIDDPVGHVVFVDARGRAGANVAYSRLRREIFRDRHFIFMRGELERVLRRRLEGRVPIRFGTSPATIETQADGAGVRVATADGAAETFDVVVGADGFRSRVRELAFPRGETHVVPLGCHTAAYVTSRPVAGLDGGAFVSIASPGFAAAAYALRGGRAAGFFVHRADAPLADRSPRACRRALEATYRGRGRVLDELLDAFPDEEGSVRFDEVAALSTARLREGRAVLVGDASGGVSLPAGPGASLAMFGGYVLAQELGRDPGNVPRALERYEARVRPLVAARQRTGRRNLAWFLPRTWLGGKVRDSLAQAAARTPIARLLGRYIDGERAALD